MKTTVSTQSGSVRLFLIFVVFMIGAFWKGGQDLYTALTNSKQTVMSYSEYARQKPNSTWVMLTNCWLDLPGSVFKHVSGSRMPTQLYVPVYGNDTKPDGSEKSSVFLKTRDPKLLQAFSALVDWNSTKPQFKQNGPDATAAFPQYDVNGLVCFGLDSSDKDRSEVGRLQENAAPGFVIVADGEKPSLMTGIAALLVGFGMLGGGVLFWVRRNSAGTADGI